DIQDIGARYYTYQATLGYVMEVAAETGTKVVVLDRPNPIDGVSVEGNIVNPGFESFVSAYPIAVRHGMTMGELGRFFKHDQGIDCDLEIIQCEGWYRDQWLDQTDLPWVFPSPNMPTLETAAIYPGMCLIEATNLSEGRGTTRPFHLVGAPWLDRERFTELCRKGALDANLQGVAFRPASFEPRFQKHEGKPCHGIEIFLQDRNTLEPYLLGLVVLEAALRTGNEAFAWRTETYEFIDDPIAIDLLGGSAEVRVGLESRVRPRELMESWDAELSDWMERRQECLLY
ncbi:MAG: exo-beta-N-acetylmuramidase NamZ family protein, partial [Myxococcota bacterium]